MSPVHFGTVYHVQGDAAVYMQRCINRAKEARSKMAGAANQKSLDDNWRQRWEQRNATYTRTPAGEYLLFVNDGNSPAADTFKREIQQIMQDTGLNSEESSTLAGQKAPLDRFMERRNELLKTYLSNNPKSLSPQQLFNQFFYLL